MNRPLILVGGGGHCKSVIEAAESSGFEIKGILDLPTEIGKTILGYKVIGSDENIPQYVEACDFVITLGFIKKPKVRNQLHAHIEEIGGHFATIIASSAHVSKHTTIGEGTVILHGAMVNAGATIGKGCIINTLANIEHDATVGNYCHISTGAMVNGDCVIGDNTFLGSGSIMHNATSIPDHSIFSAGCVITKSFSVSGLYAGQPAKFIK